MKKLMIGLIFLIIIVLGLFIPSISNNYKYRDVYIEVEKIANITDKNYGCYESDSQSGIGTYEQCYIYKDYDYKIIAGPIEIPNENLESKHYLFLTELIYGNSHNGKYGFIEMKLLDENNKFTPYEVVRYQLNAGNLFVVFPTVLQETSSPQFILNNSETLLFLKASDVAAKRNREESEKITLFNPYNYTWKHQGKGGAYRFPDDFRRNWS